MSHFQAFKYYDQFRSNIVLNFALIKLNRTSCGFFYADTPILS